jgi:3'-phosphoadenosine 5'-phosphosulfate (PAPS) 3'-phosphatase
MDKNQAFSLFEKMITIAENELFELTLHSQISIEHKADKSAVTQCDKRIDERLTALAHETGLQVVSEEGEHVLNIVKSGNYMTIDPIDGTLGYIDYVNYAIENGGLPTFAQKDLGAKSDFCLLLGIVEQGRPKYGACYNFVTKEKILIDAENKHSLIRNHNVRNYNQTNAAYFDQRFIDDGINKKLQSMSNVDIVTQAALGLKSLYTLINPHENAVTVHRVQSAGLWDIMPAAVAANAFGGIILDDQGNPLTFTDYILLPGKGATVIKGDLFNFVAEELRNTPTSN